jgi:hypothetical protein
MSLEPGAWTRPWWTKNVSITETHVRATFTTCSCSPDKRQETVRYGDGGGRTLNEAIAVLREKARRNSPKMLFPLSGYYILFRLSLLSAPSARG